MYYLSVKSLGSSYHLINGGKKYLLMVLHNMNHFVYISAYQLTLVSQSVLDGIETLASDPHHKTNNVLDNSHVKAHVPDLVLSMYKYISNVVADC